VPDLTLDRQILQEVVSKARKPSLTGAAGWRSGSRKRASITAFQKRTMVGVPRTTLRYKSRRPMQEA
jgi:hypothetical protein